MIHIEVESQLEIACYGSCCGASKIPPYYPTSQLVEQEDSLGDASTMGENQNEEALAGKDYDSMPGSVRAADGTVVVPVDRGCKSCTGANRRRVELGSNLHKIPADSSSALVSERKAPAGVTEARAKHGEKQAVICGSGCCYNRCFPHAPSSPPTLPQPCLRPCGFGSLPPSSTWQFRFCTSHAR